MNSRRGAAGLTLFELLITLSIFAVIMTLTLFFYGQSIKATRRHDQGSEVYRRAHALFADIERYLHSGNLLYATDRNLVVCPSQVETPVTDSLLFNWAPMAHVLSVSEDGLTMQVGPEKHKFFELKSWEAISWEPQEIYEKDPERRFDYVTLLYSAVPPSVTREGRPYHFKRQVLLGRY